MKRTSFAILIGLFCLFPALFSQVRSEFLLEKNWKFTREDSPEFINPTFNDSKWQSVTVPHDWAIYGPFSSQNDKQEVAIAQDGQTEAMEHAGRTGGLPFVGVGWYRTEFEVPQFTDGKRATILFDGAMSHAKVYVNGQDIGRMAIILSISISRNNSCRGKRTPWRFASRTCRNPPVGIRERDYIGMYM